jgi:glutamine amidotransferase
MITIIDYGLGNVLAFANVYKRLNIAVSVAKTVDDLAGAKKLILPGVGAFDHAMIRLDSSGMREKIETLVTKDGLPILGICVGMQILAKSSEEGKLEGLGWIDGTVKKFGSAPLTEKVRLPHMGWNDVKPVKDTKLFMNLENDAMFYFLHSYYFGCNNTEDILASCEYGSPFCCALNHDNIYGVQFHPEKSHHFGTMLLKNFAEL